MSLLDRQLPDPDFITRDAEVITRETVALYEQLTGKTLYPAQVERLLLNVIAYREKLVREGFQDGMKLNLVRYSRGVILDYLGENVGVERVAAIAAVTTLRFTFVPTPTVDTLLPAGTRVEVGDVMFATDLAATVPAGAALIDVRATCTQAGVVGNGFAPGQVKTLVDAPPGLLVDSVSNLTESEGGAEAESDERLKERIVLAPESFSVAGSVEAYRFHAMSAHPDIIDCAVRSHYPEPGDVTLCPLLATGLPGEAIKGMVEAKCSGKKVRPINDTVFVDDPEAVDYAIVAEVVLKNTADPATALAEVEKAAQAFRDERMKFAAGIVRSQLIDALHVYGIYSVNPVGLDADVELQAWQYPRCTGITITVTGVSSAG